MKTYPFENFHHVDAAVVFCVDPRFWEQTLQFVKEELDINRFDPYTYPGGPLCLLREDSKEIYFGLIKAASLELHQAKKIILISHAMCGGYRLMEGVEGEEAIVRQTADLEKITGDLKERFPEVDIESYMMKTVSDNEITFEKI